MPDQQDPGEAMSSAADVESSSTPPSADGEAGATVSRRTIAIIALGIGLFALVLAAYSNHFDNEFHFDDSHVIEQNSYIREISDIPKLFTDPAALSTLPTNRTYRPLLLATFSVDYWLGGGLNPIFFHATGFLILLAVAALLVPLFHKVLEFAKPHRNNIFVAMILAGWYAVHTANAETINYISARSDSLSTLAMVGALVVYMYASGWKRHLWLAIVAAGVLVKANVVAIVPVLVLYELLFVQNLSLTQLFAKQSRAKIVQALAAAIPVTVVSVVVLGIAYWRTPDTFSAAGIEPWAYALTQPFVMLRYAFIFLVPVGLSADTGWETVTSVADIRVAVGAVFVIAAIAAGVYLSRYRHLRPVAFGIFWFFMTLAWTSSVIPRSEITNDHRMFLPFIGLVLAFGWSLALLAHRFAPILTASLALRIAVGFGIALLLVGHAAGTFQRNIVWDTEESLWLDVTEASPNNGRGLMNYGVTQMAQGRYDIALSYFNAARATSYGEHPYLYINLGIASEASGASADQVEAYYLKAVELGSQLPESHYWYAKWLVDQGRAPEAAGHLETALQLSPGLQIAMDLQSQLAAKVGQIADLERAVTEAPTHDNLILLSVAYYEAGRYNDSLRTATDASLIDPASAIAFNNICSAHNALGSYALAIQTCNSALTLDPTLAIATANLNYAESELEKLP